MVPSPPSPLPPAEEGGEGGKEGGLARRLLWWCGPVVLTLWVGGPSACPLSVVLCVVPGAGRPYHVPPGGGRGKGGTVGCAGYAERCAG